VLFNFGQVPAGIQAREEVQVSLNNDQVSVHVRDSKQLVLFAERTDTSQMGNGVLNLATTYNVEMASISELLAPVSQDIQDVSILNDNLMFSVGYVEHPDTFVPYIRVRQNSHNLVDRDLRQGEYVLAGTQNGRTMVIVALPALGVNVLKGKDAELKLTAKLVLSGNILNPLILPTGKDLTKRATVRVQ
jgi:hypothetical protein